MRDRATSLVANAVEVVVVVDESRRNGNGHDHLDRDHLVDVVDTPGVVDLLLVLCKELLVRQMIQAFNFLDLPEKVDLELVEDLDRRPGHKLQAQELIDLEDERKAHGVDHHILDALGLHEEADPRLRGDLPEDHLRQQDDDDVHDLPEQGHSCDLQLHKVDFSLAGYGLGMVLAGPALTGRLVVYPEVRPRGHVYQNSGHVERTNHVIQHADNKEHAAEYAAIFTFHAVLPRIHILSDVSSLLRENRPHGVSGKGSGNPLVPAVVPHGGEDGTARADAVGPIRARRRICTKVTQEHLAGEEIPDHLFLCDHVQNGKLRHIVEKQQEIGLDHQHRQLLRPARGSRELRQDEGRAVERLVQVHLGGLLRFQGAHHLGCGHPGTVFWGSEVHIARRISF
mmetsp:Transcript_113049/g.269502  ORF Transcript_113049/g.269502 Transcript_113049/m.269502 type:complete len:397 (+) Transcript_113049:152-1342(+)